MSESVVRCYEQVLEALAVTDPRSIDISEEGLRLMAALAVVWPLMAAFARPAMLARLPAEKLAEISPGFVRGALDGLLDSILDKNSGVEMFGESNDRILDATRRARDFVGDGSIVTPLPPPLVQAAGDFFEAFRIFVQKNDSDRGEGPEEIN
jgi:hypothetical protein